MFIISTLFRLYDEASLNDRLQKNNIDSMEQKEFTDMADSLRHRIIAVARGYRLGDDDVEDVAQDTMLKLWTIRNDIDDGRHAAALAVTVAKNLAIDRLRRGAKSGTPEIALADSLYKQPDFMLEDNENDLWLQEQLRHLPTKEYAVLHLRQVEKKTTAEIAAIVGIAPGSVATLLARARKKLLNEIKKRAL